MDTTNEGKKKKYSTQRNSNPWPLSNGACALPLSPEPNVTLCQEKPDSQVLRKKKSRRRSGSLSKIKNIFKDKTSFLTDKQAENKSNFDLAQISFIQTF